MEKDIKVWLCSRSKEQRSLTNGALLRWRHGGEFVKEYRIDQDERDIPDYICWLALQGIELISALKPALLEENMRCLVKRIDGLSRIQWGVLRFRPDVTLSCSPGGNLDRELFEAWTEKKFFTEFPGVAAWLDEQPVFGPEGISNSAWLRWSLSPSLRERYDLTTREGSLDYACRLLLEKSGSAEGTWSPLGSSCLKGLLDQLDGLTRLQRQILTIRPDILEYCSSAGHLDQKLLEGWTEENFFTEFPSVAAWLDAQPVFGPEGIPNSAWLRWSLSPSLRERYDLTSPVELRRYVCWLVLEDNCKISPDQLLTAKNLQWLNEEGFDGLTPLQHYLFEIRPDLQSAFWKGGAIAIEAYKQWFDARFQAEYPTLANNLKALKKTFDVAVPTPAEVSAVHYYKLVTKFEQCNESRVINLVGYVTAQLGIGEDVRMLYKALHRSGYRINLLDISDELLSDKNDKELALKIDRKAILGGINIFCCTAPECERLLLRFGPEFFDRNYCIGYFPWELTKWPASWIAAEQLVDRVWVSTTFIREAFLPSLSKPVVKVPLVVEYDSLPAGNRKSFGLPEEAFVCLFIFDSLSYMARKNPLAHVRAFKQAFPNNENAVLLIKTMNRDKTDAALWQALGAEMRSDTRIHLINETMEKDTLLSLYGSVDVYLSLHRAEGFGRTIAEAMLYGKPVVVSAYSGNLDFCDENNALLVPGTLIGVAKDDYPWSEGCEWFDPDVRTAAECLRRLFQEPWLREVKGQAGLITMQKYRAEAVYEQYIAPELEAIEFERIHHVKRN